MRSWLYLANYFTNSGKTLAFGLPAMSHLMQQERRETSRTGAKTSQPSILVVAPTRELAIQSNDTMEKLATPLGMSSVCIYGGVSKAAQIQQLRKSRACVLVGTPGRILDLADEGTCDLSRYVPA